MTAPADLVSTARRLGGLTRAQLGALAGVAPSTIGRIESGRLDPTWTMLQSILGATGFRTGTELLSRGDESAVDAAVGAIDPDATPRVANEWARRWQAAGLVDRVTGKATDVARVALQAGSAAQVSARRGARRFDADRPVSALLVDLERSGVGYALSGIDALGATPAERAELVVYVDDARDSGRRLGLSAAVTPGRAFTLIGDPAVVRSGRRSADGLRRVPPARALVDSYAGTGRSADRADAYAAEFEQRLRAGRTPSEAD